MSDLFRTESAHYLREVYGPRLARACATFSDDDFWWRPHEATNSAGNLVLHLAGNVRQWILSGIGGKEDARDRPSEFAARRGPPAAAVVEGLLATLDEAAAVIETIPESRWREPFERQGIQTTVLGAVYHVVEHLSWHTGQLVWMAKLRAGPEHGIAFYDDSAL